MLLKRNLVQATATALNTSTQNIVMAYKDLIGRHLYDDDYTYVKEQMQFLDIDKIEPRFKSNYDNQQIKPGNPGDPSHKITIADYLTPDGYQDHLAIVGFANHQQQLRKPFKK